MRLLVSGDIIGILLFVANIVAKAWRDILCCCVMAMAWSPGESSAPTWHCDDDSLHELSRAREEAVMLMTSRRGGVLSREISRRQNRPAPTPVAAWHRDKSASADISSRKRCRRGIGDAEEGAQRATRPVVTRSVDERDGAAIGNLSARQMSTQAIHQRMTKAGRRLSKPAFGRRSEKANGGEMVISAP